MSAALEAQAAIRDRLVSSPAVIKLVPAAHILDVNQRPAPAPLIIIGEGQEIDPGTRIERTATDVFHDLHVWTKENHLAGCKRINGAIWQAMLAGRLDLGPAFHCIDVKPVSHRAFRDPDGERSHGVVTVLVKAERVT